MPNLATDLARVMESGVAGIVVINMEPMFQPTDHCCICGCEVVIYTFRQNYGIAMYEGLPVPDEWDGEWGGFTACKDCFDKNERGELPRWNVEQLAYATRPEIAETFKETPNG